MRIVATGLRFPEGPVWLTDGSIALVEVEGKAVSIVAPDGRVRVLAETGGGPNGLAVGPDGAIYVCNNGGLEFHETPAGRRPGGTPVDYSGGRIERIDPATGATTVLYDRCGDTLLRGPNDIVFDRHGGFYFSDLGKTMGRARDIGAIYYAQADGSGIVELAFPMLTPNGVGLSPDEGTLYVAETLTSRLWAFELEAPGRVRKGPGVAGHGGRPIGGLGGYQMFDSLAMDAGGNICVATLLTGEITVFSPAGEVIRRVKTPDAFTTNICFGGPKLDKAFLTMAGSGQLAEVEWLSDGWSVPGLRLPFEAASPFAG
jgi:gluconolactonase